VTDTQTVAGGAPVRAAPQVLCHVTDKGEVQPLCAGFFLRLCLCLIAQMGEYRLAKHGQVVISNGLAGNEVNHLAPLRRQDASSHGNKVLTTGPVAPCDHGWFENGKEIPMTWQDAEMAAGVLCPNGNRLRLIDDNGGRSGDAKSHGCEPARSFATASSKEPIM
jgi:hypothetical protein